MRIQHNIMAMNAYRNYSTNTSAMQKNLERLSSGYKINRAGDDAAGLAISEKMRAQITGLEVASKNAKDGISLVQTAEGALTEVHDMLNRMVELATQSANGTYAGETDRLQLQKEVDQLCLEINRIADSANFNGIKLLDGSMDATIRTTMNQIAESFGIADWVGTTANNSATVGDGTIVHTGATEASGTVFSVELNNATVSSADGVSIKIGDNEVLELTGTEIKKGAKAEDIAAAIAEKYETFTFKSDEGEDVEFSVKAEGTRLVFTQVEDPLEANQVVSGNMDVTYTGIGGAAAAKTERLNVTTPKAKVETTASNQVKANGTTGPTVTWGATATDKAKDKLNDILDNDGKGIKMAVTVSYDGSNTVQNATIDLSKLTKALGDDYTVSVVGKAGTALEDDKGVYTDTDSAAQFTVTIRDKASGDTVLTLATGAITCATTDQATYNGTITLSAGANGLMNTGPIVEEKDTGNLTKTGSTLFALESGLADEKIDALNQVLANGDITIKAWYEKLATNKTASTSEIHVEGLEALVDAGYTIKINSTNYNPDDPDQVYTATGSVTDDVITITDKAGTDIAKITLGGSRTDLKDGVAEITLKQSRFNKEEQSAVNDTEKNVAIDLEAAAVDEDNGEVATNLSDVDWSSNSQDVTFRAGDKLTIEINGEKYTVELKSGGIDPDDKSGTYLDISDTTKNFTVNTDGTSKIKADKFLEVLRDKLQEQLDYDAKEAAKGGKSYVKVDLETAGTGLKATAGTTAQGRIDLKFKTTNFVYLEDESAEDEDTAGAGGAGGKDPNASTVEVTKGNIASDGRLASTFITADALAGLKDGSQFRIGDKTYTFAVGKDSKYADAKDVVKLLDMEITDADLLQEALRRLTVAAKDNGMFSVGDDTDANGRLTFTENKDYEWAEGVDLSTEEGIAEQFGFYADGMETTGASGTSLTLQIGDTADSYNQLKVNIQDCHTAALGIDGIDISDQDSAGAAVDIIKDAINYVSDVRGTLGATQNRLDHTINNLSVMTENIQDAESTIRDTDIAEEMMAYTKNNILIQAAQAMLAQANQVPQGVLQLLQ